MVDEAQAFPALDASDIAAIEALGTRRSVTSGDYLFRQGDVTYDFYIVISGEVEIAVCSDGADHVVARHGPGRFVGELSPLSGSRVLVSARVVQTGEVVVLPRDRLWHLIATSPRLGDMILAAFIARRGGLLSRAATAIRVIGSRFSPDSLRTREFLARSRIPHEWLDPDRDAGVEDALREFGVTPGELPVVIATGSVLRSPTPGALAAYLGLTIESLPERRFDLVVVGGGPGGDRLRRLRGTANAWRGHGRVRRSGRVQLPHRELPRLPDGDLRWRPHRAHHRSGREVRRPAQQSLHCSVASRGGRAPGRTPQRRHRSAGGAVIAATGAHYRRLDAPRIQEFEGNGVYYAATEMEARLCATHPASQPSENASCRWSTASCREQAVTRWRTLVSRYAPARPSPRSPAGRPPPDRRSC